MWPSDEIKDAVDRLKQAVGNRCSDQFCEGAEIDAAQKDLEEAEAHLAKEVMLAVGRAHSIGIRDGRGE